MCHLANRKLGSTLTMHIQQFSQHPNHNEFDHHAHWVMIVPPDFFTHAQSVPYHHLFQQRINRRLTKNSEVLSIELPNALASVVSLKSCVPDSSFFEKLCIARKLIDIHQSYLPKTIAICITGFSAKVASEFADALMAAIGAVQAVLPDYRKQPSPVWHIEKVILYGAQGDFQQTLASNAGNNLARYFSILPSNYLNPLIYREKVLTLAELHHWQVNFYDLDALENQQAGAFLAVTQAAEQAGSGILHLRYQPKINSSHRKVALVGKGVCFDTGGLHLKNRKGMTGMHEDMQGSAVALGTLLALTQLQVPYQVDCWLALAENHISPTAYKPHDVVTASNGVSIEIVDTDAEGRMLLADTLVLACRQQPDILLDYATLTGACVTALGTRYSGIFTNREALLPQLVAMGKTSGERVWGFPLDADYDKILESEVADIKQCTQDSEVDHILAARFLKRFVADSVAWIHLDLSSSHCKQGLGHIPTDTTGFGVRYSVCLLQQTALWEALD